MTESSPQSSGPSLASRVMAELAEDKPVRLELPGGGRLHLDRRLPFVCVYRHTTEDEDDNGTETPAEEED